MTRKKKKEKDGTFRIGDSVTIKDGVYKGISGEILDIKSEMMAGKKIEVFRIRMGILSYWVPLGNLILDTTQTKG